MRYFGAVECSGIGSVIAHLYAHPYLSAVEGTVLFRQVPGNPVAILWKQCPMFYCTHRQDRVPRANTYYILRDRNNEIIEASIGADEKTRQTLEKDSPCRRSNCFI
ncbi:hypothetical protein KQX54_006636 [Cotesia glomerata]|uniref:Uncharacterized protein n=1 Tax=Cotesia glomerata TaxID=32391 RepID=A0AAV7IJZ3_COTGL|nr:hypothetical protein KQX54_006636 [Cotesia glomerata]